MTPPVQALVVELQRALGTSIQNGQLTLNLHDGELKSVEIAMRMTVKPAASTPAPRPSQLTVA